MRAATVESASGARSSAGGAIVLGLCLASALAPLAAGTWLPSVDLPQHMAQIALWTRLDAGEHLDTYRLNWFTPYLFGYSLVRLVAFVAPIELAFRIVLGAYAIALPVALAAWLRALGRPVELALVALLGVYAFPFLWGFFNYLCALPVALLFLAFGERHLRAPTRRSAALFALFSVALFFAHVIALGIAGAILGLRALALRGPGRGLLAMLPAAAGASLAVPWVLLTRAAEPGARSSPTDWALGAQRLADLPALMVGLEADRAARWLGAAVLLWLAWSVYRALRERAFGRVVPAAGMLAVFALMPMKLMDTWLLYPRLGVLVLLAAATALELPASARGRRAAIAALALACAGWNGLVAWRFYGFGEEARGLERVIAAAEPGRTSVGLVFDAGSAFVPGRPFMHFPAYLQARKGGVHVMSFAEFYPELVRFRAGARPASPAGLEWRPERFDWRRNPAFEYMLVRSRKDPSRRFRPDASLRRPRLVEASGSWWLFERPRP